MEIGGYFELELGERRHYHENALMLNSGRNCLEYILRGREYTKVYIPYYTCEAILEPFIKLNVCYDFYHINDLLEPADNYVLKKDEAFLYTNYFGLKQNCVERLSAVYGSQLIVDNAQAFFVKPLEGIDTFYSPRKFFGVPDGGYLYTNVRVGAELDQDVSYERMSHLLKRIDVSAEFGYEDFRCNEALLANQPTKKMSKVTARLLASIDYDRIREKRIEIFNWLHNKLNETNLLQISTENITSPMIYPYLIERGEELKKQLIKERIFTPTYWSNVFRWTAEDKPEYGLAKKIIPLPIDQRYRIEDMGLIINCLRKKHEHTRQKSITSGNRRNGC